jgi:hypothetical protein
MKSFIDRVLAGEADVSEVDDFVDRWHEGEGSESLAAFLGMSEDEYALWAQKPQTLSLIVQARMEGMRLEKAAV